MSAELHDLFSDIGVEETERLLEGFEVLPLERGAQRRIEKRTLGHLREADRTTGAAARTPPAPRMAKKSRRALLLIPAAACLALLLCSLAIPEVAQALQDLFRPDHRTSRYFEEQPADRSPVPDVDTAIAAAAPADVSYRVELLGEYEGNLTSYDEEYNTDINAWRIENGFGALNKEEFAFLRDIRPEVREVLYDGRRLYINTYLYTDHAADFAVGWGVDVKASHRLDATTFEYFLSVNGKDLSEEYRLGYSTGTMMTVNNQEPVDIETADGVWLTTEIDDLPAPLPDGTCEMTMLYYIYDGNIDDMGSVGNIARIIHTFTFDTTAGNQSERASVSVPLSGSVPLTYLDWDANRVVSEEVPLDGITMACELDYLSTGVYVNVAFTGAPADWPDGKRFALFTCCHGDRSPGFRFDLYVDGAFVKTLEALDSGLCEINLELPVFPSEYANLKEILIRPSFVYAVEVGGFPAVPGTSRDIGATGEVDMSAVCEVMALSNADIPVPLP